MFFRGFRIAVAPIVIIVITGFRFGLLSTGNGFCQRFVNIGAPFRQIHLRRRTTSGSRRLHSFLFAGSLINIRNAVFIGTFVFGRCFFIRFAVCRSRFIAVSFFPVAFFVVLIRLSIIGSRLLFSGILIRRILFFGILFLSILFFRILPFRILFLLFVCGILPVLSLSLRSRGLFGFRRNGSGIFGQNLICFGISDFLIIGIVFFVSRRIIAVISVSPTFAFFAVARIGIFPTRRIVSFFVSRRVRTAVIIIRRFGNIGRMQDIVRIRIRLSHIFGRQFVGFFFLFLFGFGLQSFLSFCLIFRQNRRQSRRLFHLTLVQQIHGFGKRRALRLSHRFRNGFRLFRQGFRRKFCLLALLFFLFGKNLPHRFGQNRALRLSHRFRNGFCLCRQRIRLHRRKQSQ